MTLISFSEVNFKPKSTVENVRWNLHPIIYNKILGHATIYYKLIIYASFINMIIWRDYYSIYFSLCDKNLLKQCCFHGNTS